ncbi:hypothetical protein G3I27_36860, partial [Streptomyces sp. SID10692]|nr:hypothetical protein [Streptomyces sp. SID10692]
RVRPAEDSGDRLAWAVLDCATPDALRALAAELVNGAVVDLTDDPGAHLEAV